MDQYSIFLSHQTLRFFSQTFSSKKRKKNNGVSKDAAFPQPLLAGDQHSYCQWYAPTYNFLFLNLFFFDIVNFFLGGDIYRAPEFA